MMIQQYVEEIESDGEWSLVYFGGTFSHAIRKRPSAGDFRVQVELGGTAEAAVPPDRVRAVADALMAALSTTPVIARVDLIATRAGVLLMELELIEPELFLSFAPRSSRALASAIRAVKLSL